MLGRRRRLNGSGRRCRGIRLGCFGGGRVRGLREGCSSIVEYTTMEWGVTLGERVDSIPNLGIYDIVRIENDNEGK